MKWITNLERKVGRYAISNLHIYLAIISLAGSLLDAVLGGWITVLCSFSAPMILQGQVWRLVSWIFVPSLNFSFLSILFIICVINIGKHLEFFIGTFRMNFYLLGGILLYDVLGMLVYFVWEVPVIFSLYYILLSIFMALAICTPDSIINFNFIFPIRMKWLLVIYFADLLYQIYSFFQVGTESGDWRLGLMFSAEIIFALLNLGLFFLLARPRMSRKARKRRRQFKSQMAAPRESYKNGAIHKCVICGRTEKDGDDLTFRYCSKCEGGQEYCQEHLFTHEHKRF